MLAEIARKPTAAPVSEEADYKVKIGLALMKVKEGAALAAILFLSNQRGVST
ncbi:hypothetical protein HJB56_19565 [Rhizobium lentis]|uniref:hypothetical protein n=1 Tax=Rhizobium lentis TaxID=1138194 RepID=UPI001A92C012|nr:hypothetical protein [Rhizobium lentis]MBX4956545.1 hypothetical protein [Rhizobium lentis]MBX4975328.1 hypothetical protein [Rhizobium lentis]MBX4986242.1 hypothetical protein [Rhizobium lentis]MBX4999500.1 hypothetical protein [Rhizobium lentis]MBX5004686.1 hypothetical protein [Rhizobium lentis]